MALERSGYRIERWERPLNDLVAEADPHTVVIIAEPDFSVAVKARESVSGILDHGGRVLATGFAGALLLPDNEAERSPVTRETSCNAQPEGFGRLANSGIVHMQPGLRWKPERPEQRAQYTCRGDAVVVSYAAGRGEVVWWADSQPLENAVIAKDGDLALLLNSLGADPHSRIVWDESLHGDVPGLWSYANGTPVRLLGLQLALVGLLLVLSFSRRSGPLRAPVMVPRSSPVEFATSMGDLYEKGRATGAATEAARRRLVRVMMREAGVPQSAVDGGPQAVVAALKERLGGDWSTVGEHLRQAGEAARENPAARAALELARAMAEDADRIRAAVRPGSRAVRGVRVA